ncbi:universal stress protein [Kitasatospora sp. DSM 101779]|uniref:universal stress protein n=1 Tax=Kitasatospora sp. DSM 101779 TaxID=2853165 RepID=UPI0021D9696C|nr:universal stress protein [Kitasatospora sp. DSM 101779]MCU7820770.1 universal stress protein [Kitasatospora sp. DSM 101779]
MPQYVLAGIDGSPESAAAARWAAEEAVRRGLALRLVHAQTWLDDIHADRGQPADVRGLTLRMLADAREDVISAHPALEVGADLIGGGDPVDVLAEAAAGAELLVLGSRGLGGFAGLVVGSVGLALAGRSEAPTVLVRHAGAQDGPAPERAAVVVGVDTRSPAPEVLDFAFQEAARRGAVLRAVHGWTPPPVWGYAGGVGPQFEADQFSAIEAELLDEALTGWREKYPEVAVLRDCRIAGGAQAVVDTAADAALVVVGRRRRRHRIGLHLGPVAHAVLHHAEAPVAVVPHD